MLRIADLARPELTPLQRAAIQNAEARPPEMTSAAILSTAVQATGLDDFGAADFLERLEIWLLAATEDKGLNAFGRHVLWQYALRYATNRLCLENLWRRHPEIGSERIDRPLFIAGLPRSGTTHLVNLLATDPSLRSLPYWEAIRPFPSAIAPAAESVTARRDAAAREWQATDALLPHLKAMHEMSADHVHEDLELMAMDFTTYNIEWTARVPRWRDWYLAHDRTPHYAYLRRALKALQWLDGRRGLPRRRWLLKCPQHLENLPALMATFPDACVVLTHRDPIDVIQSAATTIAYGDRLRRDEVDPPGTAAYWIDRIDKLLRALVRDRDAVSPERSLDIFFTPYMADEVGAVRSVCSMAGLRLSEAVERGWRAHVAANPRGVHGRLAYDFMGDFGLDTEWVRRRFAFYAERFPRVTSAGQLT